jgi:uncharacterized protein (TIGR02217 family)
MAYWLSTPKDQLRWSTIARFDPRYWTIDFPRPMMASCTTFQDDSITLLLSFATRQDLAGLIWWSNDPYSHPLLSYEQSRDYRGVTLEFRWESSSEVMALNAVNGPVLTIEGRDASGTPRTWYVRLWNYAQGAPNNATITLDFDKLEGGFLLPGEADPVYAGDIDRLFISLVSSAYISGDATPIASEPVTGRVTLNNIRCTGRNSLLEIGDVQVPSHRLRMASGYDDVYNLTPERVVRAIHALGYRDFVDHYVGMSHYPHIIWNSSENRFVVKGAAFPISPPALEWHISFFKHLKDFGLGVIVALSYELFDSLCPQSWKQRAHDGTPALTGWSPPSTLLSPTHIDAQNFLKVTAQSFAANARAIGVATKMQIGEPWWWSGLDADRKPCFYDASTTTLYTSQTGLAAPVITSSNILPTAAQLAYCTWLGAKLAASTSDIRSAIRANSPGMEVLLLVYTPQILDGGKDVLLPANIPVGWAFPAFDGLQLEDYDFVIRGDTASHDAAVNLVRTRLAYPDSVTDYYSGFILFKEAAAQWFDIDRFAVRASFARDIYVWAYPQVVRDGFTFFNAEDDMTGFHDEIFPLAIGLRANGGPVFSTIVTESASGHEHRNIQWAQARRRYDAAPGVRSELDVAKLLQFFEARQGRAFAFRYRDPLDHSSAVFGEIPTAQDQTLGVADGIRTQYPLLKHYGEAQRRITRPVAASVLVAVNSIPQTTGWSLADFGVLSFSTPPASGASITAGYLFDVPVRFEDDALEISLASYRAGELRSVPLIEVREG